MEKFIRLTGVAAPMRQANISTDAIIPSVWAIKPGIDLGAKLFANERFDDDGHERTEFILNRLPYRDSKILLAGANFGCGSSREAAVWALQRFGIRCVIAPSFGEIFRDNMVKNGLLPVELDEQRIGEVEERLGQQSTLTVDLDQTAILAEDKLVLHFMIPEGRRKALLEGLDDFAQVQACNEHIDRFEAAGRLARPWVWQNA